MSVSVERELDDPAFVNLKPLPVPPLNLNLNLTPRQEEGCRERIEKGTGVGVYFQHCEKVFGFNW